MVANRHIVVQENYVKNGPKIEIKKQLILVYIYFILKIIKVRVGKAGWGRRHQETSFPTLSFNCQVVKLCC